MLLAKTVSSFNVVFLFSVVLVPSPLSENGPVLSPNLVLSLVVIVSLVVLSTKTSVASSFELVAGGRLLPSSSSPDEFLGILTVLLTFSSFELRLLGLKIEMGNVVDLFDHHCQPVCEEK